MKFAREAQPGQELDSRHRQWNSFTAAFTLVMWPTQLPI